MVETYSDFSVIDPVTNDVTAIIESAVSRITPEVLASELNLPSSYVSNRREQLERYIKTAVEIVEGYTWLDIDRKTYRANYELSSGYFAGFVNGGGYYRLRVNRSPILSVNDITEISYLDESTQTYVPFDRGTPTADGLYENTTERIEYRGWATVYFDSEIPFDRSRHNAYKVRVTYNSGYTQIPSGLEIAILQIAAAYFTNRGDCGGDCVDAGGSLVPSGAKAAMDRFKISNTVFAGQTGISYGW